MTDLSLVTNVITSLFCAAVLVQTVRLSQAVHKLRHAGLIEVVASLEAATETSQQALGALTKVLSAEGPPLDAAVRGARDLRAQLTTLRDELSLMIEIGNGVAERILAAANGARGAARDTSAADAATAPDVMSQLQPTPTRVSHQAAEGSDTAPADLLPAPAARSRRSERSGRGDRGAPAAVSRTDASTVTKERDLSPAGELDHADGPLGDAAKESQS